MESYFKLLSVKLIIGMEYLIADKCAKRFLLPKTLKLACCDFAYFMALLGKFIRYLYFLYFVFLTLPTYILNFLLFHPKCRSDALEKNQDMEFERNKERFTFLKVF